MKNGPEISNAHVWDPTEAFWKKYLSFWKFYGTLILKKRLFRNFLKEKKSCYPPKSWPIWTKFLWEVFHIIYYLLVKFYPNWSSLCTKNCVRKSKICEKKIVICHPKKALRATKFFLGITKSPLKEFWPMVHRCLPYHGNVSDLKTILGFFFSRILDFRRQFLVP